MFTNIKALILDCDGLLVDSELLQFKARQKAAACFGHELSEKDFLYFWFEGNGGAKTFCAKYGFSVEEYQTLKHQYYDELIEAKMELCQGIEHFLSAVHGKYTLALCSNSKLDDIEKILKKFHLEKYFDVLVTGDELERAKPWPDGYLLAAKKLNVSPLEAVVFENSHIGLAAAKAAGMRCVIVPDVFGKKFQFSSADAVVTRIDEALKLLA